MKHDEEGPTCMNHVAVLTKNQTLAELIDKGVHGPCRYSMSGKDPIVGIKTTCKGMPYLPLFGQRGL